MSSNEDTTILVYFMELVVAYASAVSATKFKVIIKRLGKGVPARSFKMDCEPGLDMPKFENNVLSEKIVKMPFPYVPTVPQEYKERTSSLVIRKSLKNELFE